MSALVQVMVWCCQAASHYLKQWWCRPLMHVCITTFNLLSFKAVRGNFRSASEQDCKLAKFVSIETEWILLEINSHSAKRVCKILLAILETGFWFMKHWNSLINAETLRKIMTNYVVSVITAEGLTPLPGHEPMMVSLLMHICITWPQWVNVRDAYATYWKVKTKTYTDKSTLTVYINYQKYVCVYIQEYIIHIMKNILNIFVILFLWVTHYFHLVGENTILEKTNTFVNCRLMFCVLWGLRVILWLAWDKFAIRLWWSIGLSH